MNIFTLKGASTNIGSKSSLILSENQGIKKWILKMSDGDGKFCEKPRESFVKLIYTLHF
jgi:hypothetical protein